MTRNDDDHSDEEDELLPGYDANPIGKIPRREPRFGGFYEDEDEYEEPDRDTDYTSGYRADNEEEEFEDSFSDEEDLVRRVSARRTSPRPLRAGTPDPHRGANPIPPLPKSPMPGSMKKAISRSR